MVYMYNKKFCIKYRGLIIIIHGRSILVNFLGYPYSRNERKSEKAHITHAPTLLENAVYNEWQFQALVTGNRTENQFHLITQNDFGQSSEELR